MDLKNLFEMINWIGIILTILGSIEISREYPRHLLINILYAFGCICFILYFLSYRMYPNIVLYIVLLGFALLGIKHHKRGLNHEFK